jgi:serine/threonine protein phosphatase 1
MNKIYVIADIHGCYRELTGLFEAIGPDEELDTLVFLGDYVNRGEDSRGVVDFILSVQQRFRHVVTLMGNHELILLNYLRGEDKDFFLQMGGEETLKSYGLSAPWPDSLHGCLPDSHVRFFEELGLYWEDEQHIFVHAGMQPRIHISQQSKDWLLWARGEFVNSEHQFPKKIIYGHTPFKEPKVDTYKIGIDTGAVYGGKLTCLVLPEGEFVYFP